jgi:hypothetical protein
MLRAFAKLEALSLRLRFHSGASPLLQDMCAWVTFPLLGVAFGFLGLATLHARGGFPVTCAARCSSNSSLVTEPSTNVLVLLIGGTLQLVSGQFVAVRVVGCFPLST